MWLLIRPVILLFSLIQRNFYERDCFTLPFIFLAWGMSSIFYANCMYVTVLSFYMYVYMHCIAIPIIPIAVYGVVTFTGSNFNEDLRNRSVYLLIINKIIQNTCIYIYSCWLDSFIFPGYFLYMSLGCVSIVILCTMFILSFMVMSSYTISRPGYAQLFEILLETVFFCVVVGMYFASSIMESDAFIFATAGAILLDGVYFFIANGLARAKIRHVMICKDDKFHGGAVYKNQLTATNPSSLSSSFSSNPTNTTSIPPRLMFHGAQRMNRSNNPSYNDFTMDYITDYIPHQYRYPLNMWDQVRDGKKVRKPKKSTTLDHGIKGGRAIGGGQGSSEV